MKKNSNNIYPKYVKHSKILRRITDFAIEGKVINDPTTYVIWIKRIITFIENELPKTEKYQKIVSLLEDFITTDKNLSTSLIVTGFNVGWILVDLAKTCEFDLTDDLSVELNPKVRDVSLKLFQNKHYAQAVFESLKILNNFVKTKAGITDKDLSGAMAEAFNEKNPIIKLNDLKTQSDIDEQRGFKFLFMGAMTGIRNPIVHETYELAKLKDSYQ